MGFPRPGVRHIRKITLIHTLKQDKTENHRKTDDTTNDDAAKSWYHYRAHADDKADAQILGNGKLSEESENSVGHAK